MHMPHQKQMHFCVAPGVVFFILSFIAVHAQAGRIGFCYGRFADNLPPPSQVVTFLLNQCINRIRIYDSDPSVIEAFAKTEIELVISILNDDLQSFQTEQQAVQWVNSNIAPRYPDTNITAIIVGDEVVTINPGIAPLVLPAMQNIHAALTNAGFADQIRVTTTQSMGVVQNSFPPSSSVFNVSFADAFIRPMLDFFQATESFFMVNVYPYIAYNHDPQGVSLDYALFEPEQLVTDPNTNLQYSSMFDAQIDALYFAMEAMGHKGLRIVASETGWPTKADGTEQGANAQNAATYNNNLAMRISNDSGTPHRPGQPIDAFVFSLFDEDSKPGPLSEQNWGVYNADGTRKYFLDFQGTGNGAVQNYHGTGAIWCVARPEASNVSLAKGLNWACGQGNADCGPIQEGQPCYEPNSFVHHASYAYNSYYQKSENAAACNFSSTALLTTTNPSYGSCIFPSNTISPTGSIYGNSSSQACHIFPYLSFKIIALVLLTAFWLVTLDMRNSDVY